MTPIARKILKKILPKKHQLGYIYFKRKLNNELDPEMLFVSKVLKNKRRFLDIGSNIGIYSYHFKNTFKYIDAFEPLGDVSYLYADQSECFKIHNLGLSNHFGELKLYIPVLNGKMCPGLASFEKRDGAYTEGTVRVTTVDSFGFEDVDLIKIDVEGHERSVIEGALKTIKKTMPILIVEIEQRHIDCEINDVFQSILSINYDGFFISDGSLIPLEDFSYEANQKPYLKNVMVKEYVNNFIFMPNSEPPPAVYI